MITRTATGLEFNLLYPDENTYCIEDISAGLTHVCRFGGQTKRFYSVGQHSSNCYLLAKEDFPDDYVLQIMCLMHDAPEAYLGDILSPRKDDTYISGVKYSVWERAHMKEIIKQLKIPWDSSKEIVVHEYDRILCKLEAYYLQTGAPEPDIMTNLPESKFTLSRLPMQSFTSLFRLRMKACQIDSLQLN